MQCRAGFLKATQPTTREGIEKDLGSGMIRGIGPVYAARLVAAFGEAVFELIEAEPTLLDSLSLLITQPGCRTATAPAA